MKQFLKGAYHMLPFKGQIFTLLKKVYIPDESIYRHLHFHGVIKVKTAEDTYFKMNHEGFQLENEIFWAGLEGGWEKSSVGLWIKLVKDATSILDIGANTGIYSLIAKAINPTARVYAFEPLIRIHQKLQRNAILNNYDIQTFPIALSDKNGKAHVYDNPEYENNYSVTVNKNLSPDDTKLFKIEIDIITLDSFIDQHQIKGIDLVKMDVETHEGEVMEGFMKYLPSFKPIFLIEILRNEVGDKVQNCLTGLGYLYFNIDEDGGVKQVDKISRRGHNYNYLLCLPAVAKRLNLRFT